MASVGNGWRGGKAGGLACLNGMLQKHELYDECEGVRLMMPRTVVIITEYFDQFIKDNGL